MQLHAYLNQEQRIALHNSIVRIETKREQRLFWETFGRKFFLKGREFSDALHSARGELRNAN